MTDALSEIAREDQRQIRVTCALDELSLVIWYYARMRPPGALRDAFLADTLNVVSERLRERLASFEEGEPELQGEQPDLSRWKVSEYTESPFEKCGRLFIEGNDLVIRSDLDARGFCIPLVDLVAVLDGEPQPVLLLSNHTQVGVAKRSASGKAMNFVIEPFLYTSPLARVMDVVEGSARKAAVFMGREEGEG